MTQRLERLVCNFILQVLETFIISKTREQALDKVYVLLDDIRTAISAVEINFGNQNSVSPQTICTKRRQNLHDTTDSGENVHRNLEEYPSPVKGYILPSSHKDIPLSTESNHTGEALTVSPSIKNYSTPRSLSPLTEITKFISPDELPPILGIPSIVLDNEQNSDYLHTNERVSSSIDNGKILDTVDSDFLSQPFNNKEIKGNEAHFIKHIQLFPELLVKMAEAYVGYAALENYQACIKGSEFLQTYCHSNIPTSSPLITDQFKRFLNLTQSFHIPENHSTLPCDPPIPMIRSSELLTNDKTDHQSITNELDTLVNIQVEEDTLKKKYPAQYIQPGFTFSTTLIKEVQTNLNNEIRHFRNTTNGIKQEAIIDSLDHTKHSSPNCSLLTHKKKGYQLCATMPNPKQLRHTSAFSSGTMGLISLQDTTTQICPPLCENDTLCQPIEETTNNNILMTTSLCVKDSPSSIHLSDIDIKLSDDNSPDHVKKNARRKNKLSRLNKSQDDRFHFLSGDRCVVRGSGIRHGLRFNSRAAVRGRRCKSTRSKQSLRHIQENTFLPLSNDHTDEGRNTQWNLSPISSQSLNACVNEDESIVSNIIHTCPSNIDETTHCMTSDRLSDDETQRIMVALCSKTDTGLLDLSHSSPKHTHNHLKNNIYWSKDSPDSFTSPIHSEKSSVLPISPVLQCHPYLTAVNSEDMKKVTLSCNEYKKLSIDAPLLPSRYWKHEEEELFVKVYNKCTEYHLGWPEILTVSDSNIFRISVELRLAGVNKSRQQCSDKLKYLLMSKFAIKRETGEITVIVQPHHRPRSNQLQRKD